MSSLAIAALLPTDVTGRLAHSYASSLMKYHHLFDTQAQPLAQQQERQHNRRTLQGSGLPDRSGS